jgi:hypothetical protein
MITIIVTIIHVCTHIIPTYIYIYFNIISYENVIVEQFNESLKTIVWYIYNCLRARLQWNCILGAPAFPMKYYNYVRMFVLRGGAAIIVHGF